MNMQTLQQFRRRLVDMNRSIHEDAEAVQETAFQPSGGQVAGEISNAPMHLGDRGTEEFLSQLSSALLSNQESLITEIEDAVARLDSGRFGICESCGQPIAEQRLEALPFARQCIQCASRSGETRTPNLNDGRPRTPDDTLAPEGEMSETRRFGQFEEESALSTDGSQTDRESLADTHAVGTPGGGAALGGLAGSNVGRGDPQVAELEDAMGNGAYQEPEHEPIERPRDRR